MQQMVANNHRPEEYTQEEQRKTYTQVHVQLSAVQILALAQGVLFIFYHSGT